MLALCSKDIKFLVVDLTSFNIKKSHKKYTKKKEKQ